MRYLEYIFTTLFSFTMAINQEQRSLMMALKNSLQVLCPGVDICGNSTTLSRNVVYDDTYVSCCKACSCAEDCKKGTCCFNDALASHEGDMNKTCQYSTVFGENAAVQNRSYYMIDSPPEGGCVDDTHSCDETYAWGDIFPVITTSTNVIYKTPGCAKCHGISEYEEWDAELICIENPDSTMYYQILEDLFRYWVLTPGCGVKFTVKGETAYAGNDKCYFEIISECKDNFSVPPNVEMTHAEIVHACKYGPRMPFAYGVSAVSFYNVYCYICNKGSSKTLLCETEKTSLRHDANSFTAVLDYEVMNRRIGSDTPTDYTTTYAVIACIDEDYGSSFEIPPDLRCREVLCPTGQTRDVDGTCVYFTAQWFGLDYLLMIDIGIEKNFEHLTLQINDIVEPLVQSLQMPSTWLNNFILHAYPCEEPDSIYLNITVLYIIQSTTPYNTMLAFVDTFFKRHMILEHGGLKIPFTVTFNKFGKFDRSSSNILNPVYPFPDEFNVTKICYMILKEEGASLINRQFLVTPMHFCEQIALMPSEYRLWQIVEARAIQYRGYFYYGAEFQPAVGGHGEPIVRICLEGSGFKKMLLSNLQRSGYGLPNTTDVFTIVGLLCLFQFI